MTPSYIVLQWCLWITATGFFLLMTWVSGKFFRVNDKGAARGKRLMAVLAGGSSVYAIASLLPPTDTSLWRLITASILFIYATAFFIWAWKSNQAQPLDFIFSEKLPVRINQSGPYRHVRHPFYSSYCAAWLGTAIAGNSLLLAILSITLIAIYIQAAMREEHNFSISPLSDAYQAYKTDTGMLIPI